MRWLIPRLPHLAANVPDLTVHLSAGGGPDALDDVDVAIRRDDFAFPGRVSGTRLFGERIGPVCRPDLAGELLGEAPFAGATLLHTRTRPGAWEDWRRLTGTGPTPDASPQQTFEHFYLTLQAAAAGVGVAIGPYALVHDEVTQGRLAAPFGFVADGTSYHLLSHRPPAEDPQVARLLTWLRARTSHLNAPKP
ncbi:LysR substrate-binding domain-containing protein [Streptomyces sp. NPDC058067]|uniref:LysR substrate-binding domain-containing protein n=1 Tax=Streptomyces sp. NPDC058067 TaxID=3346324 RepID=UPI0036E64896